MRLRCRVGLANKQFFFFLLQLRIKAKRNQFIVKVIYHFVRYQSSHLADMQSSCKSLRPAVINIFYIYHFWHFYRQLSISIHGIYKTEILSSLVNGIISIHFAVLFHYSSGNLINYPFVNCLSDCLEWFYCYSKNSSCFVLSN